MVPNSPARLATARSWSNVNATCSCMVLTLVFAALEEAPDKRLVDDGNRLCRFVVSRGEVPSANHTHTEILHIAGAHAIPRRTGLLLDLGWWVPGNKNHLTPVVG